MVVLQIVQVAEILFQLPLCSAAFALDSFLAVGCTCTHPKGLIPCQAVQNGSCAGHHSRLPPDQTYPNHATQHTVLALCNAYVTLRQSSHFFCVLSQVRVLEIQCTAVLSMRIL